jgi:hypothetical protein
MARVRGASIADQAAVFLRCRTYNHAWDEFYPIDLEQPWYGWRLSLRCTRCTTERHDLIDFKGAVMGRRYIYAEGYLNPKGDPRVERTVFREELFTRLRAKLEEVNGVGAEVTPIKSARKRKSA